MFFKHFASKSQLPGLSISGTLVENGAAEDPCQKNKSGKLDFGVFCISNRGDTILFHQNHKLVKQTHKMEHCMKRFPDIHKDNAAKQFKFSIIISVTNNFKISIPFEKDLSIKIFSF